MGAPDACEHGRDKAVLAVEWQDPLGELPRQRREPPLDRGDGPWPASCARGAGRERREIEADAFRVGERLEIEALAGAPAQIVALVGGVGAVGVFRRRRAGVGAGGLDERLELGGKGSSGRTFAFWQGRGSFPVMGGRPSRARTDRPASGSSAGRRSGAGSRRPFSPAARDRTDKAFGARRARGRGRTDAAPARIPARRRRRAAPRRAFPGSVRGSNPVSGA